MLFVSTEATKISRDKARLKNAHILSQSIQYYKMIHGAFPQSGPSLNISDLVNKADERLYLSKKNGRNKFYLKED